MAGREQEVMVNEGSMIVARVVSQKDRIYFKAGLIRNWLACRASPKKDGRGCFAATFTCAGTTCCYRRDRLGGKSKRERVERPMCGVCTA